MKLFSAVHTGYRYMEYRLYICRTFNWKASFSWKNYVASVGPDDWSFGNTITRSYRQSNIPLRIYVLFIFFHFYCITIFIQHKQIRHEKPRKYLSNMRKKKPVSFSKKFPNADPLARRLLEKMLAFEPKDRPTCEQVSYLVQYLFVYIFVIWKRLSACYYL